MKLPFWSKKPTDQISTDNYHSTMTNNQPSMDPALKKASLYPTKQISMDLSDADEAMDHSWYDSYADIRESKQDSSDQLKNGQRKTAAVDDDNKRRLTNWKLTFKQPASDIVKLWENLERQKVVLENVAPVNDLDMMVGTVRVADIAYQKRVFVRHTINGWKTYRDEEARHSSTSEAFDTFRFDLELPRNEQPGSCIEFCVCFVAGPTSEEVYHWDSNDGDNFVLVCSRLAEYSAPALPVSFNNGDDKSALLNMDISHRHMEAEGWKRKEEAEEKRRRAEAEMKRRVEELGRQRAQRAKPDKPYKFAEPVLAAYNAHLKQNSEAGNGSLLPSEKSDGSDDDQLINPVYLFNPPNKVQQCEFRTLLTREFHIQLTRRFDNKELEYNFGPKWDGFAPDSTRPDRRKTIIGDGNCMFRALSYGLMGTEQLHLEVRQCIAFYYHDMHADDDRWKKDEPWMGEMVLNNLEPAAGGGANRRPHFATIQDYAMFIAQPNVWGDAVDLVAAAKIFNVNILVFYGFQRKAEADWICFTPNTKHQYLGTKQVRNRPTLLIEFIHHNHYNVVLSIKESGSGDEEMDQLQETMEEQRKIADAIQKERLQSQKSSGLVNQRNDEYQRRLEQHYWAMQHQVSREVGALEQKVGIGAEESKQKEKDEAKNRLELEEEEKKRMEERKRKEEEEELKRMEERKRKIEEREQRIKEMLRKLEDEKNRKDEAERKLKAQEEEERKKQEEEERKKARRIECLVCFDRFPVTHQMISCSGIIAHTFCRDCICGQAVAANDAIPLAEGGQGLMCMVPDCKSAILYSDVRPLLEREVRERLDERITEENIGMASIPNLERCRDCNFAIEMEVDKQVNKVFNCLNCRAKFCRICDRRWDEEHFGKACEELDAKQQKERKEKRDRELENQLNEAVIRKCPRCNLAFQKDDGCNKMTCRCGMTQCYLCRQSDIDYTHFCQHARDPNVTGCIYCSKGCTLYQDANRLDAELIEQIRKRHEREEAGEGAEQQS